MARTINMLEAINEALSQEMERDERVFLFLGEDIGLSGGVFKVTDGLLDKFGEERGARYPACRGHHHRGGDWVSMMGLPSGAGDSVC